MFSWFSFSFSLFVFALGGRLPTSKWSRREWREWWVERAGSDPRNLLSACCGSGICVRSIACSPVAIHNSSHLMAMLLLAVWHWASASTGEGVGRGSAAALTSSLATRGGTCQRMLRMLEQISAQVVRDARDANLCPLRPFCKALSVLNAWPPFCFCSVTPLKGVYIGVCLSVRLFVCLRVSLSVYM